MKNDLAIVHGVYGSAVMMLLASLGEDTYLKHADIVGLASQIDTLESAYVYRIQCTANDYQRYARDVVSFSWVTEPPKADSRIELMHAELQGKIAILHTMVKCTFGGGANDTLAAAIVAGRNERHVKVIA